jgi:hypothetical protein
MAMHLFSVGLGAAGVKLQEGDLWAALVLAVGAGMLGVLAVGFGRVIDLF